MSTIVQMPSTMPTTAAPSSTMAASGEPSIRVVNKSEPATANCGIHSVSPAIEGSS